MDPQLKKATRQHTRDHNSRMVLRAIYNRSSLSRADLARQSGLTRTTVSDVVGALIDQGLVEETGFGQIGIGRTPMLLRVVPDARLIGAVSLSTKAINGALINVRGEVRRRATQPLASPDGDVVLAGLHALLDTLLVDPPAPLLGIGISTPGLIDTASGTVSSAVNFGWKRLALGPQLQARYRLPVYIANDSHTLALAEYTFGSAPGNLVVVKVGQGVGAGIILNGALYNGDGFGAGEIGHVVVDEQGPVCKCGNRGCLETLVGVGAVLTAADVLAANPASALHAHRGTLDLALLRTLAEQDHAGVRDLVETIGRYLGIALANIVGLLNIHRVIVTGRVAQLGEPLRAAVHQELNRRALPALTRATSLTVQPALPDTPLLGACALPLVYELGLTPLAGVPRATELEVA